MTGWRRRKRSQASKVITAKLSFSSLTGFHLLIQIYWDMQCTHEIYYHLKYSIGRLISAMHAIVKGQEVILFPSISAKHRVCILFSLYHTTCSQSHDIFSPSAPAAAVHLIKASATDPLNALRSNSNNPWIVDPPGVATFSFTLSGVSPPNTNIAAPFIVSAAMV